MIAVDSSAFVAIVTAEEEAANFARTLLMEDAAISAATRLELAIVVHGKLGANGTRRLDEILKEMDVQTMDFTEAQSVIAADAWRRYGRGSGSPAKLNFGDCFSYALARSLDVPLLFKGDDFALTDITAALVP
ncbi:type II toxin-antitoxin system VapC family toxin [Jiella endophytica]|uniref:type II toxin-antitoxin system VapC family toxin n=1 Tax=Jiella endophytica TaxID=2558362 RepID=UPI001FDF25EA|nr:type II toxin-antitoxin system VapC family toxin [Jiella endophytica]